MLTSLAYIFLLGLALGGIFKKLHLPSLMGMIITGVILGPYALDLLDASLLNISADLRELALVIILTRAGLSLNLHDLRKIGRPAILMCFVPATFEMIAVTLLAPLFMDVNYIEAALMGSVLAAVSPAVIVPRMIKMMEEGYGKDKNVPQLILAGASVDDVFVIVVFSSFLKLAEGKQVSVMDYIDIPISIALGVLVGVAAGYILVVLFRHIHMRDSVKILVLLGISFLLLQLEESVGNVVAISGLIAIMSMAITINQTYSVLSVRLSGKYNRLWVCAELILFVLVGAIVDPSYITKCGFAAVAVVLCALVIRMIGVLVCLIKTPLNSKERLFSMMAYTPKATVQAAIGGVPLAMGLVCGNYILTVAVLAILITAPVGALMVDLSYKKLLNK